MRGRVRSVSARGFRHPRAPVCPPRLCRHCLGTTRCSPITVPLGTAPTRTTDRPATVFVQSKCSGTASLGGRPGPKGAVPSPSHPGPPGLPHKQPCRAQVRFRLTASPAGCYQVHLAEPCAPREAEVRPATTDWVSFQSELGPAGWHARTAHSATCPPTSRSLTHVRTTHRPHQSPPTCLRLTYQHLVHGPACEIGMVRLFLWRPGCRPKSTLWGGGVAQQCGPPTRQHDELAPMAVYSRSSVVYRRATAALVWWGGGWGGA